HRNVAPPPQHSPPPLHDALPISTPGSLRRSTSLDNTPQYTMSNVTQRPSDRSGGRPAGRKRRDRTGKPCTARPLRSAPDRGPRRSEEHTSELQSRENLVCRLLLE